MSKKLKYNRVTSVLNDLNSAWKEWWFRSKGFQECDRVRDEATTFGKKAHSFIEAHLRGAEQRQECQEDRCAVAIINWLSEHQVKPLYFEEEVKDTKLKLIGHFDLLGELNGEKVLFDYKTSKDHKKEHGLQLAAYSYLTKKTLGLDIKKGIVLKVDKQTTEIDPKEYNDLHGLWKIFLGGYKYYLAVK